jgi:hypothetical protein
MTTAHREGISYIPPVFVLAISFGSATLTVTLDQIVEYKTFVFIEVP